MGVINMAFESKNFRLLMDTNPQIWSYVAIDEYLSKIKARDYFSPVKDRLAYGNWIMVSCANGATILHVDDTDPLELSTPQ